MKEKLLQKNKKFGSFDESPRQTITMFSRFVYSRGNCDDSGTQTVSDWKMSLYDVRCIIEFELQGSTWEREEMIYQAPDWPIAS